MKHLIVLLLALISFALAQSNVESEYSCNDDQQHYLSHGMGALALQNGVLNGPSTCLVDLSGYSGMGGILTTELVSIEDAQFFLEREFAATNIAIDIDTYLGWRVTFEINGNPYSMSQFPVDTATLDMLKLEYTAGSKYALRIFENFTTPPS